MEEHFSRGEARHRDPLAQEKFQAVLEIQIPEKRTWQTVI